MYLLGTFLIVTAIAMALLAVGSYAVVIRQGGSTPLLYGRFGVYASLGAVVMAWTLMITLFLARRFDIEYVNNYSSRELDLFFTVAASWAGQPGSFLIWILFGSLASALLIKRSRHFEPYALLVFMLVQAGLLTFVLILNPFKPLIDPATGLQLTPPDGRGLNPLLHNFWMIIHPPVLFVGYALATVPFAFAVGALIRRDYDTWVARALPWTLAAWSFLGLGLLLGGYWAYETLGWGGYWGWDPVENSSLVPWLTLTALLHGMLVQRIGGGLRKTNLLLALMTYVLVFYATFLTRSGVYANFSVHSFVAEGIFEGLVAFLVLLFAGSLSLLLWRSRDIPARGLSDKFFSRDSFFVLGILTIVLVALVVGLGTSMPVISAIPGVGHTLQGWMGAAFELDDGTLMNPQAQPFEDGRFSLAPSFYQQTTPPLALVAVVLMTLGPLLGWRDSNLSNLLRALRWPALAAVIATVVAMFISVRDILALFYVAGATFALGTNLVMIQRTLKSGWMRIGGYLAHVGFAIMLLGFVGSSAYATPDTRLTLAPGERAEIFGYEFTFNGYQLDENDHGVLDFTVSNGERTFSAQPYLYENRMMGMTITAPSIHSFLWYDLYISPAGYDPERDQARPVLGQSESADVGPYHVTFLGFNLDRDDMAGGSDLSVGARLMVRYEGQNYQLEPLVQIVNNTPSGQQELQYIPADLPGGHGAQLTMVSLDPGTRRVMLQASGPGMENLPVTEAKGVIAVSVKPLVILVWVGATLFLIGGFIATLRRYLENHALLAGVRPRLPRGWSLGGARLGSRGVGR
ncbi:heme lyase CcmF/NrfE family subunit [Candidatus Viridilinea mediisalina]|uniref:Cytochrome C biogenesis protein n=1 Tax=Candidatus Viridilinea mediisalina TaxID=2024553 RepID=A0A2A6RI52_9CHLR|nr:cytochrome c-type biogenesis CcmF C-terminal domain-containing protein [Candidatus Viridilinea mediisalina]PDW02757.1 cytochrome C biogenesis protein [Candidatus Viridilinea mediisalina]